MRPTRNLVILNTKFDLPIREVLEKLGDLLVEIPIGKRPEFEAPGPG